LRREDLPALATARIGAEQQELPARAARCQPASIQLISGKMFEPCRHFGQRDIAGRRAISQVHRIESTQGDQQGVNLCTVRQPGLQPCARRFAPGQAGHRVAGKIGFIRLGGGHCQ